MKIMILVLKIFHAFRWVCLIPVGAVSIAAHGKAPLSLFDVPGIWQSEGYGWYIKIANGKAGDIYHVNDGRCLQTKNDTISPTIAGLSPMVVNKNGQVFTAKTSENITQFQFRKVVNLPKECTDATKLTSDPIVNFQAAWEVFNAHYAFFAERKVDWNEVYRRYKPQVTSQTTPEELYTIVGNMLAEMNDRHVILQHTDGREFRAGLGPIIEPWIEEFAADPKGMTSPIDYVNLRMLPFKTLIEQTYMVGPVGRAGQGQIVWGRLKGDIGYIRLDSLYFYDARSGYKFQKKALEAAVSKALLELKDVKAFVIDMRFNLGGNDGLGLKLMSHFADTARLGYTKQSRAGDGFTAPQKIQVVPARNRFKGKVAVLIGNVTVSAGENFTIATLPFPHIFRVGEPTAGAMSDVLMKPLPNGWQVGISNEIFRAANGRDVEVAGIKPDILIPNHFSATTLLTKQDRVLETALSKLSQ
jgi:carboxyl-terminal processing protease